MASTSIKSDSLWMRARCTLIMCMTVMMCEAVFEVAHNVATGDAMRPSATGAPAASRSWDNAVCSITAKAATAVCNVLSGGFSYQCREVDGAAKDCIVNEMSHTLFAISPGCTGMRQVVTFACILLAAPGRARPKAAYLVIGSVAVLTANLLRIALVACSCHDAMQWFHLAHDVAGASSVYATMIVLWAIYVERWIKRWEKEKQKT